MDVAAGHMILLCTISVNVARLVFVFTLKKEIHIEFFIYTAFHFLSMLHFLVNIFFL